MNGLTIISGCPGSGKTTLARSLARRSARGVHVVTDEFYDFLAHPLDPTTPESRSQNAAVLRAFLHAAVSFSDDGYEVFVDGVIGPWWLETITAVVARFEYVLLHADLATAEGRVQGRADQPSASVRVVRHMHAQLEAVPGFIDHRIDTSNRNEAAVVEEFLARRGTGAFDWPKGECAH
ncbi:MAG: AAA family ATPase [Pseudomonadales bacterium]